MYSVSLERFPLPQLSTYTLFSILSLFTSLIHVLLVYHSSSLADPLSNNSTTVLKKVLVESNEVEKWLHTILKVVFAMYADSWCFWSVLNMAYCVLVLLGKSLQSSLFGQLREEEENHIREKFWNFVFYRVIFLYGVLNIQTPLESTLWTSWSTLLGFLHLLTHLCKDRSEMFMQLTILPSKTPTSENRQWKIILLLIAVFCIGLLLGGVSILVGVLSSWHRMSFMMAEVLQLQVVTIYVLLKYAMHLRNCGNSSSKPTKVLREHLSNDQNENPLSEQQLSLWYRVLAGCIDMVHHIHMLLWSSLRLNVTTLVILLHLQYLYQEISTTWKRYKDFKRVVHLLNSGPIQNSQSLCSICWDVLGVHRLLPCGHGFHKNCLLLWIPQSCTCPVCRKDLLDGGEHLASMNVSHVDIHASDPSISQHSSQHNCMRERSQANDLGVCLSNSESCSFYQVTKRSFYLEADDDEEIPTDADNFVPINEKKLSPHRQTSFTYHESGCRLQPRFASSDLLTGPLQVDLDIRN